MNTEPNQPGQTREQFLRSAFLLDESKDNYLTDKAAQRKLIVGIQKGVDAIKVSYGSAGSNAFIESDMYPFHLMTNDGKAILNSLKLADPIENMGLNILKEVAEKQDKEGGDGRKTAVVLTGAILEEGKKADVHPMELKRSLDECLKSILNFIDSRTKPITADEIGTIATLASEDKKLGALFQEIYQQIGADGIVNLDNSGTPDTYYEIVEGVRLLNCGFQWPYMANEDKGRQAVYNYPKILITKQKINSIKHLDDIFRAVAKDGRDELVIFCEDIDQNVSTAVAYLHHGTTPTGQAVQPFKTLIIKAPTLWKDWLYEDFAKISGATVVDPAQGKTLKNFNTSWLGNCDKIITTKDETVVLGIKDISDHLKVLEDTGTDEAKIRLARLKTKTANLKLGAHSETELSYVRGKALDARNASYLALNGGVVEGGGVTLLDAINALPKTVGGNILKKALQYPLLQILSNLNIKFKDWEGYDEDILDPARVVKNAVTNALSVASTVLTSNVVITKIK